MRLLWVKYGQILPANTGGRIRSFNLLRHLSRQLELTFLSYYGGARDAAYEQAVKSELPGAVTVHAADLPAGPLGTTLAFAETAFAPAPFTTCRFTSRVARAHAEGLLTKNGFDVALCDFLTPTLVLPRAIGRDAHTPVVLFEHNVESDLWRRRYEAERRPHVRPIYWWESRRMQAWEARMLQDYDHVLAVSEHDRSRLLVLAPGAKVDVIPTGVDTQHFSPAPGAARQGKLVVFVGSMDWEPNVDGVRWFYDAVWPLVRLRQPAARFRIVGRSPGPFIRSLAGPDVEVTGSVQSVVEHLREAAVVVVPLRVGGGTRLKIYEAMATGAAVISTTIGAEGLDVEDGKQILLRDEPGDFAEALVRLLDEPHTRDQLATAGREHAVNYDWSQVAAGLKDVLAQVRLRS